MTTQPANAIPTAKDAKPYTGPGAADIANLITASLEGHIAFQPLNVAVVIWPKGQPETIFLSTCSQAAEAAKAFHKAKELMDQHGGPKLIVADAAATELLKKAGRL